MISTLTRFVFLVGLAFIAGFIALSNLGPEWAIFVSISTLSVPLLYS
jgi:hypothetical protein